MTDRELGTILAALRFWQANENVEINDMLCEILTDNGRFSALTNSEIDDLCERINYNSAYLTPQNAP